MVPIRVASGVRMKILEAWSRGVPVVATEAAAAGLAHGAETALLRESDPAALALAIETLAHDPDRREALVGAGRRSSSFITTRRRSERAGWNCTGPSLDNRRV